MMRAVTIDPEARYLDHEMVIRELEEAEREYKLDAAGVIEKLKEAVATCQAAADRYVVRAAESRRASDSYVIALGKYLAEIKRRVELPKSGNGSQLRTTDRPGWKRWCRDNGVSHSRTYTLMSAANGDMTRVNKRRQKQLEYNKNFYYGSSLAKLKRLWGHLTPPEREEFIRWALSQKDYGPPAQETTGELRERSAEFGGAHAMAG